MNHMGYHGISGIMQKNSDTQRCYCGCHLSNTIKQYHAWGHARQPDPLKRKLGGRAIEGANISKVSFLHEPMDIAALRTYIIGGFFIGPINIQETESHRIHQSFAGIKTFMATYLAGQPDVAANNKFLRCFVFTHFESYFGVHIPGYRRAGIPALRK